MPKLTQDAVFVVMPTAKERQLFQEIASSQVRKVPLEEYQPGAPHYERLMNQVAEANRYKQPDDLRFNF